MMTIDDTSEKARVAMGSHDCLSKQGARAVLLVLLLACIMALSAILLILGNDGSGAAAAQGVGGNVQQNQTAVPHPMQQGFRSPA